MRGGSGPDPPREGKDRAWYRSTGYQDVETSQVDSMSGRRVRGQATTHVYCGNVSDGAQHA